MIRTFALTSLTMALVGFAAALAVPQAQPSYSVFPPTIAEVDAQLRAQKISLAKAIDIAQSDCNGIARSANVMLDQQPPAIEVVVYAGQNAQRVLVDSTSGEILSRAPVTRFPGEGFAGELTELPSGVKYADVRAGDGDALANDDDAISFHVVIYLINGHLVHDSHKTEATQVLFEFMKPALREGMAGMKAGGLRKIIAASSQVLPGSPLVPPDSIVVFDLELLGVNAYTPIPDSLPGEPVRGEPVITPSGLRYYDLTPAACSGPRPARPDSTVKVHYTGYLNDGTIFDSSHARGEPLTITLDNVIAGWSEGLRSMSAGCRRKLIIPYELGYSEAGQGRIPPKAVLIIDVELIEIVNP